MARAAREIMNRELFSLRSDERTDDALGFIVALGVSGAPVLDESGRPIGVISFHDLVRGGSDARVGDRMTTPAITVTEETGVEEVARIVGERGVHRVVVVDDGGVAVGIVSSVDLVRALVGMPARHPSTFPHYDEDLGASWTDDTELELEKLDAAPDGPGVLVLVRGGVGVEERVVWAEPANNVRTRLYDILSLPQSDRLLGRVLTQYKHLRFRAACISDPAARLAAARALGRRHEVPSREG